MTISKPLQPKPSVLPASNREGCHSSDLVAGLRQRAREFRHTHTPQRASRHGPAPSSTKARGRVTVCAGEVNTPKTFRTSSCWIPARAARLVHGLNKSVLRNCAELFCEEVITTPAPPKIGGESAHAHTPPILGGV